MRSFWAWLLPDPRAFAWKLVRAAWWLLPFTLLTLVLEHVGVLTPFSNFAYDSFSILRGERTTAHVHVVDIDDDAYRTLFKSRSPLGPRAVHDLIDWVEAANPAVIAIDISTSDPSFTTLRIEPTWRSPIVWTQDIVADDPRCTMRCTYRSLPVRGGAFHPSEDACTQGRSCAGVPWYIERAGIVREYSRHLPFDGVRGLPTLAWAAVEVRACADPASAGCRAAVAHRDDEDARPLQPTAPLEWPHTTAALKLRDYASTRSYRTNSELRDHIVVIGGSYAGEDQHTVPSGRVTGAWLNAQIVENELGPPLHELPWLLDPLLDLALGVVLVYLLYRLAFVPGLLASAAVVIVVLLACFVAFGRLNVWIDFVPIVFGVALHEFQEHFSEYVKLRLAEQHR